jgi:hypothetical protein
VAESTLVVTFAAPAELGVDPDGVGAEAVAAGWVALTATFAVLGSVVELVPFTVTVGPTDVAVLAVVVTGAACGAEVRIPPVTDGVVELPVAVVTV